MSLDITVSDKRSKVNCEKYPESAN